AAGVLVGLPALRMTGVYLTIATLAFALIIQEVFTRWDRVTGGLKGKAVQKAVVFGLPLGHEVAFYFLCLAFLIAGLWLTSNLLRSPTGRAWVAIRDSEVAAQSMGVNLAVYKTLAFAYSAGLMGVAGALFAHKIGFLAPDIFSVLFSIQFLLMVVVGGLGSLHGAVFGAAFVAMLPVLISQARDSVPAWVGAMAAVLGRSASESAFLATGRFVKQPGLEPGQVFTIIGPNGAGKTTIFNLVSRIYDPTQGRLIFCDEDITRVPPHEIARRGIARTFQNIELFEHATVLQNLLLGRHVHARSRFVEELLFLPRVRALELEHREAVETVIDFLDLQPYRDSLIANLPYGVRKVVEMGRALCTQPKLLLLDEPSSGLSVEETDDMAFWIQDIRTLLGITVLMVE